MNAALVFHIYRDRSHSSLHARADQFPMSLAVRYALRRARPAPSLALSRAVRRMASNSAAAGGGGIAKSASPSAATPAAAARTEVVPGSGMYTSVTDNGVLVIRLDSPGEKVRG